MWPWHYFLVPVLLRKVCTRILVKELLYILLIQAIIMSFFKSFSVCSVDQSNYGSIHAVNDDSSEKLNYTKFWEQFRMLYFIIIALLMRSLLCPTSYSIVLSKLWLSSD